jgi:YVTN family beta-propeller protein
MEDYMETNVRFWQLYGLILGGLLLVAPASTSAQPFAYTGGSSQVTVVEVTCGAVVDVVAVGSGVRDVTANSLFTRVYTADLASRTVSVIDPSDPTNNPVIATIPVDRSPLRLRLTPNDAELWVANFDGSSVSVIDTTSNTVTDTITPAHGLRAGPAGVAFAPDGSVAYIPNFFGGKFIQVFDTATRTLVSEVALGDFPCDIDISPDGLTLYAARCNIGIQVVSVSPGDPTALTLGKLIVTGGGNEGLTVSPDGSLVAVGTFRSAGVHLIDAASNTLVATLGIGGSTRPSFTSDGSLLFVPGTGFPSPPPGAVTVDVARRTVVQSFQFGQAPQFRAAVSLEDPSDVDADGDLVGDLCDNCPNHFNPAQGDNDSNGIGNLCDPEFLIADLIADLQDIVESNPGTPLADKVEDAQAKLETALDELTKTPPDNQAAVGNIEDAVGDLEAAVDDGLLDEAQGTQLMNELAGIARLLAVSSLEEAIALGGDPDVINDAQQALDDGDALRASEAFKDAVNKYKDALSIAKSVVS